MGVPAQQGVATFGNLPTGDRANTGAVGSFSGVGPGLPVSVMGPANALAYASQVTTLTTSAGSIAATLASATGLANGANIYSPAGLVPPGSTISGLAGTNFNVALPTLTLPGTLLPNGQIIGLPSVQWLSGATVFGPGIPSAGLTVISTAAANPQAGFPLSAPAGAQIFPQNGGSVQLSAGVTPVASRDGAPQSFQFKLAAAGIPAGADTAAIFTGAGVTFNATVQLERSFDGGNTWIVCNIGGTGALAQYTGATVGPVSLTFAEPEQGVSYRWNCIGWTSGTINHRISTTGAAATVLPLNQLS
jgi:hypothetical protein